MPKISIFASARGLRSALLFTALACALAPSWAQNVNLGTASAFGVLAGTAVTNTGPTIVTGSVGVSPLTAITGFPPGMISPGSGTFHSADVVAAQAQNDLTTAYNDAATRVCGATIPAGTLGGLVLVPGVYCMASGSIIGALTLNGPGVYIFQIGSTLTTASASSVLLVNGAEACGVWWQVGSSATLGTNSSIAGNIMALTSITATTGANVNGRTLARNGAATLDTNNVIACSGGPGPGVPSVFAANGAVQTPTLSEWTMVMLAALLAAAGFAAIRRR